MAQHYAFDSSDYHGMSGDLGANNTTWIKRLNAPAAPQPPDPTRLSREYSQPLAPPDLLSLAVHGLHVTISPTDFSYMPHLLAGYQRTKRVLAIDWRLLPGAPREVPTPDASSRLLARWSQLLDTLPLVRFLVGWSIATHASGCEDFPIHMGYIPLNQVERYSVVHLPRYLAAWRNLVHLFAPRYRLLQQAAALGLPLDLEPGSVGNAWKDALRTHTYQVEDTACSLIQMLAQLNICPPVLIEASLANIQVAPDWRIFARRLVVELPQLALRQQQAVAALYGTGALPLGTISQQQADRLVQLVL